MSTISLKLKPSVEAYVKRKAARQHVTVEELIGKTIEQMAETDADEQRVPDKKPMTGGELLAKWEAEGVIWRTDMTEDTVEYAQKLRERSQRRSIDKSH